MKHISDLFSRYHNLIKPPQSSIIKEFVGVCGDMFGFNITLEQCDYSVQSRTLFLNVPSVLKSELIKNKQALLTEMKKRLGDQNSPLEIL